MAVLLRLGILAVFLCSVEAYLTGGLCRDYRGRFAISWTQCSVCTSQSCRCVFAEGRVQADCERVRAAPLRVPPGCSFGRTIQTATTIACCPIVCPRDPFGLEETCDTSFGQSYYEGDSWTKCSTGQSCCFESCTCVRTNGRLTTECHKACPKVSLGPGCQIVSPFQNATYRDCCRIECPSEPPVEAQCLSSFGTRFSVGRTWEECSPTRGCCTKSCSCVQNGDHVEPRCIEACPGLRLLPGCTVIDPIQNATYKDCCRTQCPEPPVEEQCLSSFGTRFSVGRSWEECSPSRGCCTKSCSCVRTGDHVEPRCNEACPGLRLLPGCTIIDPIQNATFKDCCRTQCPGPFEQTYLPTP